MKLRDIYARDGLTFSIEFFPPKSDEGVDKLFAEIEVLKELEPDFCSVTYGAGGSTRDKTVDLVIAIKRETGLETMCHVSIVDQPKAEVRRVLRTLRENGIENLIALAGDPPGGAVEADWEAHPEGFANSRELVAEARKDGHFSVAVAGFPEIHPRAESREADLGYLKAKVDAGADVIITQLFFDNEDYFRYVEDARRFGIGVPIVPGMLPIKSASQVRRFTKMCAAKIPQRLDALLDKVADDNEAAVQLGIEYTSEQCRGLLDYGVPGFHFYSLNQSRSVKAIFDDLSLGALT
ncbi:MAG: methylenetetrahydrofolate reductase [NAD(P)H] [Actinomycetota bacterium]|nr:methylenetetrahydrofolate reductase [NAD(P)H] [Actinomycetota bacterium]